MSFAYTGLYLIQIYLDGKEVQNSPILLRVSPRRCVLDFKDDYMLRVPNEIGICVCNSGAIDLGNGCFAISNLLLAILLPFGVIVVIIGAALYAYHKRKVDAIWSLNSSELKFQIPPVILGRGSFGLVVLGVYRGTPVAVKRVLPQTTYTTDNPDDTSGRLSGQGQRAENLSPFTDIADFYAAAVELGHTGSGSGSENDANITNVEQHSPIDSTSPASTALRPSWRSKFAGSFGWMRIDENSTSSGSGITRPSSNAILPTGDFATASDFRKTTKRPVFGSQVGLRSSNNLSNPKP